MAAQHFEAALQDGQQVVEIVGHPARQLAQRFHSLRLVELGLRPRPPVHLPLQSLRGGSPSPTRHPLTLQLTHRKQCYAQQAERGRRSKQQIINEVTAPRGKDAARRDAECDIEWIPPYPLIAEEPLDTIDTP